jgi:ferric-dicitrate binding protein FerR (iron transport regulator)
MELDNQLIEKYLSGTCTEEEIKQILEWLGSSGADEKELFDLKILVAKEQFNRMSQEDEIQPAFRELISRHDYKEELKRKLTNEITRKITMKLSRYAAAILLLIGMSVGVGVWLEKQPQRHLIAISIEENEAVRRITLEDNTKVWLFENSKIEYPQQFAKDSRKVSVEGKVYFEVAKDQKRPFRVNVGGYTVEALGTAFEVTGYKNKKQFDVILTEGLVLITDPSQKPLSTLQPGCEMVVNTATNEFRTNRVDADVYTSWVKGVLEFDGMTFPEIAKVLERFYNVRIVLEDPETMKQHLVGSLSLKKDIAAMMRAIEAVIPIKYSIESNTYVHIKKK